MTIIEFENRAKSQNGYNRQLDGWKIIDIHQIPIEFDEKSEVDFYCSNDKTVYLLRLRSRETEFYEINTTDRNIPYLIAELPIKRIDDGVLKKILNKFK
ncbi:hypothetical protein [uncultured Aquimarina sp.]|uniref:hypothetical protein n=1 Tax=uncultured Aquimarina sp. TaxID=575652 RepID=UPI0026313D2E|nr:hypothetical protein [uncultured Aquimarina sp.]